MKSVKFFKKITTSMFLIAAENIFMLEAIKSFIAENFECSRELFSEQFYLHFTDLHFSVDLASHSWYWIQLVFALRWMFSSYETDVVFIIHCII